MRGFFILVSVGFLGAVASLPPRAGFPVSLTDHRIKKLNVHGAQRWPPKTPQKPQQRIVGRHLAKSKETTAPSTEYEQNAVLEKVSPEYKYDDKYVKNIGDDKSGSSSIINDKDSQIFSLEDDVADVEPKSVGFGPVPAGMTPLAVERPMKSMEEFNVVLQNTLPEYQYDREAHRGLLLDSCADLDPDCDVYEIQGLCSDNPDFAAKRYYCKKTCRLCRNRFVGHIKRKKDRN